MANAALPRAVSPTLTTDGEPGDLIFCALPFARLSQAHSGPSAVFIDELDAGLFQGATDGQIICGCH
jgi:hypothetical protein